MPKTVDDRPKPSSARTPLTAKLTRAVSWHRRKLAALCALLAVFAGLSALTGSNDEMVEVVSAAKQLPAGTKLTASDLRGVSMPKRYLPAQAVTDSTEVLGRTTVATITSGSVLTSASVLGDTTTGANAGEQLVPIRVADAGVVNLLRVGDRISVVATTFDGQQSVLAAGVRVAALPQQSGGPVSESGALVVVAADVNAAARLAGAATQSKLGVVLH